MITPDAPVQPADFKGRSQAIRKICEQILNPERLSAAVVGGPRTGKTSLLRYLASPYADGLFPGVKHRVYLSAELLSANARPANFWRLCCQTLLDSIDDEALAGLVSRCLDTGAREMDLFDLQRAFDGFGRMGTPVVLMIDHWDMILKNQNYWGDLFHGVRALGQRLPRGVCFVVAAQRPLLELWVEQMGSIYYNTFANVTVGILEPDEIRQRVREALASNEGTVAGPGDVAAAEEIVLEASDGHPWLAVFVTSIVARQLRSGGGIDRAAIGAELRDPQGKLVSLVRYIRASLAPSERLWLDSLRTSPATVTAEQRMLLGRLRGYGLLPPGTRL